MIAMHPEVQLKIVQELKEVFGTADAPVDYDSLNNLVYLDLVLKETMRLFPVLPVSARKSTDEFEIGETAGFYSHSLIDLETYSISFTGEYTIPAGATIIVDAFTVQRNKKYWGEDAGYFRPERFEPQNFEKIHPYAYIPFTGELLRASV
jgi:cytochrome P450